MRDIYTCGQFRYPKIDFSIVDALKALVKKYKNKKNFWDASVQHIGSLKKTIFLYIKLINYFLIALVSKTL